jgi:hypothetical protein
VIATDLPDFPRQAAIEPKPAGDIHRPFDPAAGRQNRRSCAAKLKERALCFIDERIDLHGATWFGLCMGIVKSTLDHTSIV